MPFGRPRLRVPRDRPPVHISPRKRRRLTYDDATPREDDDYLEEEKGHAEEDSDDEQLLLTQNGEETADEDNQIADDPASIGVGANLYHGDPEEEDEDTEEDDESDEDMDSADDLADDLRGLQEEAAEFEPVSHSDKSADRDTDEDNGLEKNVHASDDSSEDELDEDELRAEAEVLRGEANETGEQYEGESEEQRFEDIEADSDGVDNEALPERSAEQAASTDQLDLAHMDNTMGSGTLANLDRIMGSGTLADLDRITALRAAFPMVSSVHCEKLLVKHNWDIGSAWQVLRRSQAPRLELAAMLIFYNQLEIPKQFMLISSSPPEDHSAEEDGLQNQVDEDDNTSSSGGSSSDADSDSDTEDKQVAHNEIEHDMASSDSDDDSDSGSDLPPPHPQAEDDDTSSSGSDSDKSDSDAQGQAQAGKEVAKSHTKRAGNRRNVIDDSTSSDSDSDDDEDMKPDKPTKGSDKCTGHGRKAVEPIDSSSSSGQNESAGEQAAEAQSKERRKLIPSTSIDVSSSEVSSDTDSSSGSSSDSSSDSDSDSESEAKSTTPPSKGRKAGPAQVAVSTKAPPCTDSPSLPSASKQAPQPTVPPGRGISKTQKRNRRRTLEKQSRRLTPLAPSGSPEQSNHATPSKTGNHEYFMARKVALLRAVAASSSPPRDTPRQNAAADKTKPTTLAVATPNGTVISTPASAADSATASSRRKSRLDIEAAGRMNFGALGVKNPKSKAEDVSLMKDVRPHHNPRVGQEAPYGLDRTAESMDTQRQQVVEEDPDAWRDKIAYRAVECCREGVQLSEPPFPFVQRWDPQQHSKRKLRDAAQYRDEESQHSAKKRKIGQADRRPLDETYQEDTTTFSLSYDDVDFDPEDSEFPDQDQTMLSERGQSTGNVNSDDLPALPQDLSALARLIPGEAKPGMIITYSILSMGSSTRWQPQVRVVTAMVTEVEPDGAKLKVQLAKRDREVKRRDADGNRVYAGFEGPDEDEEDDDLGHRDVAYAKMVEPRIVQQAPPSPALGAKPPQLPQLWFEVADSQPQSHTTALRRDSNDSAGVNSGSNGEESATLDHDKDESRHEQMDDTTDAMMAGVTSPATDSDDAFVEDESLVAETNHDTMSGDLSYQPAQRVPVDDVSITEERRGEISQIISEEGFRKTVRSSIDQSTFLRFDSPTAQLRSEEYAESARASARATPPAHSNPSSQAPSEYGSKEVSQEDSHDLAPEVGPDSLHDADETVDVEERYHDNSEDQSELFGDDNPSIHDSAPASPSGKVVHTDLDVPPSTQASEQNGQQPEPVFYSHSDDLGVGPSDSDPVEFNRFDDQDTTADFTHQDGQTDHDTTADASQLTDGQDDHDVAVGSSVFDGQGDRERTPTQQTYNDNADAQHNNEPRSEVTPLKFTQGSSHEQSPPPSGDSTFSNWSIPSSIVCTSSQPAKTKFKERIKEEFVASQEKGKQPEKEDIFSEEIADDAGGLLRAKLENPELGSSPPAAANRLKKRKLSMKKGVSSLAGMDASVSPPPRISSNKGMSNLASTEASVSPPPLGLSKTRQLPLAPSSQNGSNVPDALLARRRANKDSADGNNKKKASFMIPPGSQTVSLLSSDAEPEAEPEPEPEISEMYADDSVDGDYDTLDSFPTKKLFGSKARQFLKRLPQSRTKRGASVPAAEAPSVVGGSDGIVAGSQGPRSRVPSRLENGYW